jgi:hypothetical protein
LLNIEEINEIKSVRIEDFNKTKEAKMSSSKNNKMPSSEQPPAPVQPHVSYYWNDVLEWERQAKEEAAARCVHQREEEQKEQTKSAAAKDLLEALQEEEILDNLEIKQEIVLDPTE